MTRNQIDYMKHKEEVRHNLASESETKRSNQANESQTKTRDWWNYLTASGTLEENRRHNLVTESTQAKAVEIQSNYNTRYIDELTRSNRAREAETFRYNSANLDEIARHNRAYEVETNRHNEVSEAISLRQADASYLGSQAAASQAAAAHANVGVRSGELAALMEYRNQQIDLSYAELAEKQRHNAAEESLGTTNAAIASNRLAIDLFKANTSAASVSEQTRHDYATEHLTGQKMAVDLLGQLTRIVGG